ncbi:MAG: glycosyltransferase family 39 protein [Rhodobacteraceae bacterium]|nr:glycosyltransferase family 39 protein [Paracoccaceae bacterium]
MRVGFLKRSTALDHPSSAPQVAGTPAVAGRNAVWRLGVATTAYLALALFYATVAAVSTHGWLALGVAGGALLVLVILSHIRFRGDIALVMAASFCAQVLWGATMDPQPFGAFGVLWEQSRRLADLGFDGVEVLTRSASPGATAFYALVIAAVGDDIATLRLVSAALWSAQIYMVWRIAREITEIRGAALGAAALFGLAPATIAVGALVGPDALFGLFALSAVYALFSHRKRGLRRSTALAGALAGAAFLVRPVGGAFLVAVLIVLAVAAYRAQERQPQQRLAVSLITCVLGFMLTLAPFAWLAHAQDGRYSVTPATSLGYQLLLGTNRDSIHGFSYRDLESAGFLSDGAAQGAIDPTDVELAAISIAADRVASDPVGFIGFVLTEKMRRLWSSEGEILNWTFDSPYLDRAPWVDASVVSMTRAAADGVLVALLASAAFGAFLLTRHATEIRDPTRWVLVFGVVLGLAAAHFIFEARERYHLAFTPLLSLMAPAILAWRPLRFGLGAGVAVRKSLPAPATAHAALAAPDDDVMLSDQIEAPFRPDMVARELEGALGRPEEGFSLPPRRRYLGDP